MKIEFSFRLPRWVLRLLSPQMDADLERRSEITGTASTEIHRSAASSIFLKAERDRPWTVDRDGRVRTEKDRPVVLKAK